MSRPAEITKNDVAKACARITGLGQRPTVDRIHGILGKGSRTTINRLLREHLAEQKKAQEQEEAIPVVSDAVLAHVRRALALAVSEQDERIVELEGALGEKDAHISEILREAEEREERLSELGRMNRGLSEQHKQLYGEKRKAEERAEKLASYRDQSIAAEARCKAIEGQVKDYKARIKELETKSAKLLERALKAENPRPSKRR